MVGVRAMMATMVAPMSADEMDNMNANATHPGRIDDREGDPPHVEIRPDLLILLLRAKPVMGSPISTHSFGASGGGGTTNSAGNMGGGGTMTCSAISVVAGDGFTVTGSGGMVVRRFEGRNNALADSPAGNCHGPWCIKAIPSSAAVRYRFFKCLSKQHNMIASSSPEICGRSAEGGLTCFPSVRAKISGTVGA